MNIRSLRLDKLRNDAHFQFHTEFRDLVAKQYNADRLKIEVQFNAYLPLYQREDESLKKIVKSASTDKIQDADKARDEIFTGMTEMNKASLKHFDTKVREAAGRLKIVFDTYGSINRKPLNEQTSAVYNLLQELQGKYSKDTETAGIKQWVAELQARNTAFSELMKERFNEAADKSDIVLKDARKELDDDAYRVICERLNALVLIEDAGNYEPFIKTLNAVIAKYR